MADQQQHMQQQTGGAGGMKGPLASKGPSTSTMLAVVLLFPIGGFLLLLSGITLTATLFGLAVTTPVFILFSPVIVPAMITIGLAVAGFLTSGAFGITALSSMSYIVNYFQLMSASVPEHMEHAKRRAQDAAGYLGQKAQDVGQKTQEAVGRA